MRLHFCVYLLAWMSVASVSPALAKPDDDGFEHVALIRHADIDVSLLVRPLATPADEKFIGFQINNKTGHALKLGSSASYRIDDARKFDRATQALVSTGSLASGNDYDLLYRDVVNPN